MHVLLGLTLVAAAFFGSFTVGEALFAGGLVNPAALVLLALGPLGVTMISHPFAHWANAVRVLGRAFRHSSSRNVEQAAEEMARLARAAREGRWTEAEAALRGAESEQVRRLAPHLLAQLGPDELREAVASSSFAWMAEVKSADDLVQSLGRMSPAFGMIGTIMGLVELFKNMRDSASLGPGMAMALLATLYGLILCYCVYMPLAQRIRIYLTGGAQEQRLIERGLGLIVAGRPVGEVRRAIQQAELTDPSAGGDYGSRSAG